MKKIISIVGARPNFIKLATVHTQIKKSFEHIIIHTGQHYDFKMSQNFFEELFISNADYNLKVGSQTSSKQVSLIKKRTEDILKKVKPDFIIVYGDTNSTLGGALAAQHLKIPLGHIEAGVRCFDDSVAEEVNRIKTDMISQLLFCPSQIAVENLKKEGITKNVFFTGDVMLDMYRKIKPDTSILAVHNLQKGQYYLSTIHRQSNTRSKANLKKIFLSLSKLDKTVIVPLHPRTKEALKKYRINTGKIKIIEPVSYSQNIALEKNAKVIITDSGGIQKEAFWSNTPCVTLRENTEWPETVKSGWNILLNKGKKTLNEVLKNYKTPKTYINFYGQGKASREVVKILKSYL